MKTKSARFYLILFLFVIFIFSLKNCVFSEEPANDIEFVQTKEELIYLLENYWEIDDSRVLSAMNKIERHQFVLEELKPYAYLDIPLPVGYGQNISAPHMIAQMTALLDIDENSKILEIRSRAGYHTAILAEIGKKVYSLESVSALIELAKNNIKKIEIKNVTFVQTDGFFGLPGEAPFDAILVKGSVVEIPPLLLNQLADGGKLVIPVGPPDQAQKLYQITKEGENFIKKIISEVNFIPLEWEPQQQI